MMKKKLLVCLLTVLLTLSLIACSTPTPAAPASSAATEGTGSVVSQTPPASTAPSVPDSSVAPESAVSQTPPATSSTTPDGVKISRDEAKAIALGHAQVAASDVRHIEIELDRERGGYHYDIDFDAGNYEYDYEIDANTGNILKSEKEWRD